MLLFPPRDIQFNTLCSIDYFALVTGCLVSIAFPIKRYWLHSACWWFSWRISCSLKPVGLAWLCFDQLRQGYLPSSSKFAWNASHLSSSGVSKALSFSYLSFRHDRCIFTQCPWTWVRKHSVVALADSSVRQYCRFKTYTQLWDELFISQALH